MQWKLFPATTIGVVLPDNVDCNVQITISTRTSTSESLFSLVYKEKSNFYVEFKKFNFWYMTMSQIFENWITQWHIGLQKWKQIAKKEARRIFFVI